MYIGTPQERWEYVVKKEKARLKKHGKIVVHTSREPDHDSSCCIQENESYCEKFNMCSDLHVGSIWDYELDNAGGKQEFHFVFISKELDKKIKAYTKKDQKYWQLFCEENGLIEDDGIIYFLLFPQTNMIKVGFTQNIEKRLSAYKTHCAENYELIKTIPGSKFKEKVIHDHLRLYHTKQEFFEWNPIVQSLINEYE